MFQQLALLEYRRRSFCVLDVLLAYRATSGGSGPKSHMGGFGMDVLLAYPNPTWGFWDGCVARIPKSHMGGFWD